MRGHTFYPLHLLLDKHAGEQTELVDLLAERVQTLGGVAVADPRHVAEITTIPRPPDGAEEVPAMLSRLLEAHEIIITKVRNAITRTTANRDDGTNTCSWATCSAVTSSRSGSSPSTSSTHQPYAPPGVPR